MKKNLFLAVLTLTLMGCAGPAPQKFPRTAENNCMVNTFEQIKIVKNNTRELSNSSKESQCFWAAERRAYFSGISERRTPRSVQNAAGTVVIQQSINIENDNSKIIKENYYRECMQNPNVKDIIAPPAYVQLEGMAYGFSSISTDHCPAPFKDLTSQYVNNTRDVVEMMRKHSHLNSAEQNAIINKKVPSNPTEKEIIDSIKPGIATYVKMVQFFARTTGWCPGTNGLYKCDPNNIRFNN